MMYIKVNHSAITNTTIQEIIRDIRIIVEEVIGSNSKTFIEKDSRSNVFNISLGSFNEYKNYT